MVGQLKAKAQKTVKVFDEDIALINQQARELGCTAADVIHDFCKALKRQLYEQDLKESCEIIRSDPKLWAEHQAETKQWDCTLMDGLESE